SYGSYSGGFSGFTLPAAVTWQPPAYGATALTLTVARQQLTLTLVPPSTLIFDGNGDPGVQSVLLATTNLSLPRSAWTPLATNTNDINGHFSYTNAISPGAPKRFFTLKF